MQRPGSEQRSDSQTRKDADRGNREPHYDDYFPRHACL